MNEVIRLVGIEKRFGGRAVLEPLFLSVYEGEFLTFVGPSGCGKTTLLRLIAGLERPDGGRIFLEGRDITELPPYARNVNLVFQHYALFPHLTVEENILFGLKMKKVPSEEQRRRLNEVLQLTQLETYRRRKPSQLSGGQQQRVAIARALVNKPKVLLLDEPLSALDAPLRKRLQEELKRLQQRLGLTFLYVTHDQEEALALSDRIAVMDSGRVVQIGTPDSLYHRPATPFVATFIGENNLFREGNRVYAVRPEQVRVMRLDEPSESEGLAAKGERRSRPGAGGFGVVEDVVFSGPFVKLVVRVDEPEAMGLAGERLIAYQAQATVRDVHRGARVRVTWPPDAEVELG